MEIKVGEYVRTIDGYIRKVTQVNEKGTYQAIAFGKYETDVDYKNSKCISEKKITKHSPEIIDIIEIGDYINGEKVKCFRNENCDDDIGTEYSDDFGEYFGFSKEDIEDIVTKEQFESMRYKL